MPTKRTPANLIKPDPAIYSFLVECWSAGFDWMQVHYILKARYGGAYISPKQYRSFCDMLDEQVRMDLGGQEDDNETE